jgi:hypothetical protein
LKDFLTARQAPGKGSSILLVVVRAWLPSHAFFLPDVLPVIVDTLDPNLDITRQSPGFSLYLGTVFCNMRAFPAPGKCRFRGGKPDNGLLNYLHENFFC